MIPSLFNTGLMGKPSSGGGSVGGWKELARTTLGSAGSSIEVTGFNDKRYYMFLFSPIYANAGSGNTFRVGNGSEDTGSNNARRSSTDGAADTTLTSSNAGIDGIGGYSTTIEYHIGYCSNISSKEKLFQSWRVFGLTGATNAPKRIENVGKWVNTSNPLDTFKATLNSSGSFSTNSEIIILGWDAADTHTTNFWEELASVDISSTGNLDSGTFTAKKYLWIQAFIKGHDAAVSSVMRFNSDSGSNYATRQSYNGGADGTLTSGNRIDIEGNLNQATLPQFVNIFIVNNSANEKLGIMNTTMNDASGAGNEPHREERVFKWANTSSQITKVVMDKWAFGSGLLSGSKIRVWGSD